MLPKVAIVCANYNYGRFIVEGMKSIQRQTYKGEIRHAPDSTDEYNKLTYTRTISHGSKPLYVSG